MNVEQATRICALGQAVIRIEAAAILDLEPRINAAFVAACRCLLNCSGKIVVLGIGKSGHIGRKLAATFASTGSPAFFVHPSEAGHGDLGMITAQDVVLIVSNSGENQEILTILPVIRRIGAPLIAMTGNLTSTLAKEADIVLDVSVGKEACPLGLAPTASTTAALAMGDALAVAVLESKGFTAEDFARSHPAGILGRRLLLRVADIMHINNEIPKVLSGTLLNAALMEMSRKRLGMTAIIDTAQHVLGIYTDGDLRRTLDCGLDIRTLIIDEVMTKPCHTVNGKILAAQALQLMETNKINGLLVIDDNQCLIGALNMHDLLRAKVV